MKQQRIEELRAHYRRALLEDVVPFWLRRSLDVECGGYLHCLDRTGAVYDTDKAIWLQGRAVWMFSKLYNTVEPRPEWLAAARLGYDFLRAGRPLRKCRHFFSETCAIIAFAEYAIAAGDPQALEQARAVYRMIVDLQRTPGRLEPKVRPDTRPMKSHAVPMIMLATTQQLRQFGDGPLYTNVVDTALDGILNHLTQPA